MKKITQTNLEAAYAGESQAHMKYLAFADHAEKEFPNLARLYRATAYAEQVHATNHFRVLGHLGSVSDNLQTAFDGETFEIEEMYPSYIAVAKLQEEKGAERSATWAMEAEKGHAVLFKQAQTSIGSGSDPKFSAIHVCTVCGYTHEGELPDDCPICRAKKDRFRSF